MHLAVRMFYVIFRHNQIDGILIYGQLNILYIIDMVNLLRTFSGKMNILH